MQTLTYITLCICILERFGHRVGESVTQEVSCFYSKDSMDRL